MRYNHPSIRIMADQTVALSSEKRRVLKTLRECRALSLLAGVMDPESREALEAHIAGISDMRAKDLREVEGFALQAIAYVKKVVGARLDNAEYVKVIEDVKAADYEMLWVPKAHFDQAWLKNAAAASRRWHLYPPHARFRVDAKWAVRSPSHTREWRLLEATLFEDLAVLWNETLEGHADDGGKFGDERIPGKRSRERCRSTVRASFALLEAYLNGIAQDILISTGTTLLSMAAQEALDERDAKGISRFLSLRAKLLPSPVLLGEEHPLFDENTCPEMRVVLAMERKLRDAVMHSTPRVESSRARLREQAFYELSIKTIEDLMTSVIGLFRRIDKDLNGIFRSVSIWIFDRDEKGLYRRRRFTDGRIDKSTSDVL